MNKNSVNNQVSFDSTTVDLMKIILNQWTGLKTLVFDGTLVFLNGVKVPDSLLNRCVFFDPFLWDNKDNEVYISDPETKVFLMAIKLKPQELMAGLEWYSLALDLRTEERVTDITFDRDEIL